MAGCLPKHIICGTYIPDFTPGPTPCTLQSATERRSRLVAGGTFFRSIGFSVSENSIQIKCEQLSYIYTGSGTILLPVIGDTITETFRITITKGIVTETFDAVQGSEYQSVEDPPTVFTDTWVITTSAIPSFRSQINGTSTLITVPASDGIQPWNAGTDDAVTMSTFAYTNMAGGLPTAPSVTIRTGPIYSILQLTGTEDINGNSVTGTTIKYWGYGGGSVLGWNVFNPETECYNPNNIPPGFCP